MDKQSYDGHRVSEHALEVVYKLKGDPTTYTMNLKLQAAPTADQLAVMRQSVADKIAAGTILAMYYVRRTHVG